MADFEKGMILAYAGKVGGIPNGWQICDGTNGTPDLRSKFIRGGASQADIGKLDGSDVHAHHFAANSGAPLNGLNSNVPGSGGYLQLAGNDHTHHVESDTVSSGNVPAHVVLLFIMFVGP